MPHRNVRHILHKSIITPNIVAVKYYVILRISQHTMIYYSTEYKILIPNNP